MIYKAKAEQSLFILLNRMCRVEKVVQEKSEVMGETNLLRMGARNTKFSSLSVNKETFVIEKSGTSYGGFGRSFNRANG